MDLKFENLRDWVPIRIFDGRDTLMVDWIYLGSARFADPFFDDTIQRLLQRPFNQLFRHQTPIDFLGEMYDGAKGVEPAGFIYHTSRCGSTLISRMLAAVDWNIVISEASVIDKVIRTEHASEEQKAVWLRWLLNAFGQKRSGREEMLIVKLDSWAVLDLPLIEMAFPDSPWIFVYREPVEVIVSNLRQPGAQMIPAAIPKIFPNMGLDEILGMTTEERFARTIEAFCRAAIGASSSRNGKFINYKQLPEAITGEIASHFGISLSERDLAAVRDAGRFNAKVPTETFVPDTEQKHKEANAATVAHAIEIVGPIYEQLERLRNATGSRVGSP